MNQMPALLKREFQEHRNMLFHVPIAVTLIILLLQMAALMTVSMGSDGWVSMTVHDDAGEARELVIGLWYQQLLQNLAVMPPVEQATTMEIAYFGTSWPLFGILWFLVFFYLLGTLHEDRRDRSILFWKSMPVSDAITIASKLLTALVVIPVIYFACVFVVQLGFLITSTLSLGDAPPSVADVVFDPMALLMRWGTYTGYHLVTVFWCAPFYAWVLLVSAWARTVPFMWALGVPLVIAAVDAILVSGEVGPFMLRHALPVGYEDEHDMTLGQTVVAYGLSWELPVALALAAAFIYLAIRLRGRADEI